MSLPDRVRLPLLFDPVPLAREAGNLPKDAWYQHFVPQNFEGDWSVVPLRAPAGETHPIRLIYPDPGAREFIGTPFLRACPGLRGALDVFACELRAVRLMRLASGSKIHEHSDHDLDAELGTARLHVPLVTSAEVAFRLNGTPVAMRPGEVWYLRLSDPHSVANPGPIDRVHLVIDAVVNGWLRDTIGRGVPVAGALP